MNRAQTVISLGFGCYELRDDVSAGPRAFAAALERALIRPVQPHARKRRSTAWRRWRPGVQHRPFIDRIVRMLRRAHRYGKTMRLLDIYEAFEIEPQRQRTMRRLLSWLHQHGHIKRAGTYRTGVYWAE